MPIKRVPPSLQQELALLETMTQETAPRPAEDTLVALYLASRGLASIDAFLFLCPFGLIHLFVITYAYQSPWSRFQRPSLRAC